MDVLSVDFLGVIAVGLVAGLAFRPVVPDRSFRGTAVNIAAGIAGSVLGFVIARVASLHEVSLFAGLLVSIAGALLFLILVRLYSRSSTQ